MLESFAHSKVLIICFVVKYFKTIITWIIQLQKPKSQNKENINNENYENVRFFYLQLGIGQRWKADKGVASTTKWVPYYCIYTWCMNV